MAGTVKPRVNMIEANYVVNDWYDPGGYNGYGGGAASGYVCGLFNEVIVNDWHYQNVFGWDLSHGDRCNNYVDITIYEKCNIYRWGTDDWSDNTSPLVIKKYINNEWVDITDSIQQNVTSNATTTTYEKYISDLQPGRYKFCSGASSRIDTEWFIERIAGCILSQNGKYYSFLESNYNTETRMYNEISLSDFDTMQSGLGLLNVETTIGQETFKPIDKFNNFSVISNQAFNATTTGIKQNTSMIVASDTFGVRNASNIDYFKGYYTLSADSSIKVAVSVDEGNTWKTATVSSGVTTWTDLNITIPKNMYSSLTSAEKQQWDNAKDVIYNNGIDISILGTIDFNQIKDKNMMFAYVLYMPALDSVCKNRSLEWKFDSRGRMKKMKDNEYDLYLTYDNIVVTPLSVQSMIKINVVG